ncbi:MAG: MATE family efflux transporter, partial [Bacteroidaceae bacterium]|nr:MATE family efflux transporter [Bacteroidaceae bacterium]
GKPVRSIIMSLSRQLIILIPCLIILPNYFGINGVWYSMPVADGLSVILALTFLLMEMKNLKKLTSATPNI